jgi:DNA polymerase
MSDYCEPLNVPRAFVGLARRAVLHSDPARFARLYQLLWRSQREPRLLRLASDPDLIRVNAMADAVAREIHKTHAFVRFREARDESGAVFIAWFEPAHHTLEAAAPFFVRRFAAMRWSILTPRVAAHWDGRVLHFGPGASRDHAVGADALEPLWRTYYASIFNPARLKTKTMQGHMPRKYWRNMPETEVVSELVARSQRVTGAMLERPPTAPRSRRTESTALSARDMASQTIESVRKQALCCTRCPLYRRATQTVFGEGPARAEVMFVGEQPGDQEDLAGKPFVGPAGQLFDRGLAQVGIRRDAVYVTNAVKHFKFEPRGRRRLHKTPGQLEIEACRSWLSRELELVQPRLVVALGATAAHALLGRAIPVERNRGRLLRLSDATRMLVTVHPSYLLRVDPERQEAEYARFVQDLEAVRDLAEIQVASAL